MGLTDKEWEDQALRAANRIHAMHKTVMALKFDALDSTDLRAWESLADRLERESKALRSALEHERAMFANANHPAGVARINRALAAADAIVGRETLREGDSHADRT